MLWRMSQRTWVETLAGTVDGHRPDRAAELARLVMVQTSAWRIPEIEQNRLQPHRPLPAEKAHRRLLADLMGTAGAWVGLAFAEQDSFEWPAPDQPSPDELAEVAFHQAGSAKAAELVERLADRVWAKCWDAQKPHDMDDQIVRSGLRSMRHRIFLDPATLRQMTGVADLTGQAHGVVDLSFDHLLGRPLCRASVSIWSTVPWSPRYAPNPADPKHEPPTLEGDLDTHRNALEAAGQAIRTRIDSHLDRAWLRVFSYWYDLPTFWVAVPVAAKADPYTYMDGWSGIGNRLARHFLGVGHARDCVVTPSVLNGQFMVLRRVRPRRPPGATVDLHTPTYLIIPSGDADKRRQEEDSAAVITSLTRLESDSPGLLYDLAHDLEIWQSRLRVYNAVIERGALLWDALSTHLATRRSSQLDRTQRTVELLHQILLQGVADLGQLSAQTSECLTQIEAAAEKLRDEYDGALTEQHAKDRRGLRGAITDTGLFDRVRQNGAQVGANAAVVKARYDELLAAIGRAFDERRAREGDMLQKGSAVVAVALTLVGLVTILDATIEMKPNTASDFPVVSWWSKQAVPGELLAILSFAAIAAVAARVLKRYLVSSRLGSKRFRTWYDGAAGPLARWRRDRDGIWHFLKDASTNNLRAFQRGRPSPADWDALDRSLASRFARLWDDAADCDGVERRDDPVSDIETLSGRIEQWGTHGLLLTERPLRMNRYLLPRLACMYRYCADVPGTFLSTLDFERPPRAVELDEFLRIMRQLGISREEGLALDRNLRGLRPKTAADLLSALDGLGVSATRGVG
jgi:hypothetical protein